MFKLIYTSVPKGLIQGRSGFTTVAMTEGFPSNLIPLVENLSGYRTVFSPSDSNADRNPVNCTYFKQCFGSTEYSIISRIAYHGLSYTGRSNILAVHLLFTQDEIRNLGVSPAQILQADENFTWSGEVCHLPIAPKLMQVQTASCEGETWKRFLGDGNWARVLAWKFRHERNKPVFIAFDPMTIGHQEIMSLVAEISAWLSHEEQVEFTYSTYDYQSSGSNPLFIRAYPEGSRFLESVRRLSSDSVFSIGQPKAIPESYMQALEEEARTREKATQSWQKTVSVPIPSHDVVTEYTEPLPLVKKTPSGHTSCVYNNTPSNSATQSSTIPSSSRDDGMQKNSFNGKLFLGILIIAIAILMIGSIAFYMYFRWENKEFAQKTNGISTAKKGKTSEVAVAKPEVSTRAEEKKPISQGQKPQEDTEGGNGRQNSTSTADTKKSVGEQLKKNAANGKDNEVAKVQQAQKGETALGKTQVSVVQQDGLQLEKQPDSKNNMPSEGKNKGQLPIEEKNKVEIPIKEQMDMFCEKKGIPLPDGWNDFLKENYGEIRYLDDKMSNAEFVPSKYLITCMEHNLVVKIKMKLLSDEPFSITTSTFTSKNSVAWNQNKKMVFKNIGYESLHNKIDIFNKLCNKKLKDECKKYNDLVKKINKKLSEGKKEQKIDFNCYKEIAVLRDEQTVKDAVKSHDQLVSLRKKLDENIEYLKREKKGSNKILDDISNILGKEEDCNNKNCLLCKSTEITQPLDKAFDELKNEILKFPALKGKLTLNKLQTVDENAVKDMLRKGVISIEFVFKDLDKKNTRLE